MGRQEGRTDATVTVTRVERVGFPSRLEDIKEHSSSQEQNAKERP